MIEDEPNLVTSGKSRHVIIDGFPFSIEIYRLEHDKTRTLEVVDHEGTSHVWDGFDDVTAPDGTSVPRWVCEDPTKGDGHVGDYHGRARSGETCVCRLWRLFDRGARC